MKKILFLIASVFLSLASANAQSFGITAGYNNSTISNSDCDGESGFNVGFKLTDHFAGNWFWEGSALLSQKGYKVEGSSISILGYTVAKSDDIDMKLYYLHVPINFGYDIPVTNNFSIAPKAGVYLACGLWGDDGNDDDPFSDYEDDYDVDNYGRFDFGLNLGVNFNIVHHLQISAGYEWGMVELSDDVDDSQNRNLYVNLAYIF